MTDAEEDASYQRQLDQIRKYELDVERAKAADPIDSAGLWVSVMIATDATIRLMKTEIERAKHFVKVVTKVIYLEKARKGARMTDTQIQQRLVNRCRNRIEQLFDTNPGTFTEEEELEMEVILAKDDCDITDDDRNMVIDIWERE